MAKKTKSNQVEGDPEVYCKGCSSLWEPNFKSMQQLDAKLIQCPLCIRLED